MTEVSSDFSGLVSSVQLVDIRLVEAHARTLIRDIKGMNKPQLVTNYGTKLVERAAGGFLVGGMMTAHVVNDGDDAPGENSPVYMRILLSLEYTVPNAAQFSDAVLNEFAQFNATFNAWPYWREYIQTTVARMNLPPLTLPVLRINRSPEKGTESRELEPAVPKPTSSKRPIAKKVVSPGAVRKRRLGVRS